MQYNFELSRKDNHNTIPESVPPQNNVQNNITPLQSLQNQSPQHQNLPPLNTPLLLNTSSIPNHLTPFTQPLTPVQQRLLELFTSPKESMNLDVLRYYTATCNDPLVAIINDPTFKIDFVEHPFALFGDCQIDYSNIVRLYMQLLKNNKSVEVDQYIDFITNWVGSLPKEFIIYYKEVDSSAASKPLKDILNSSSILFKNKEDRPSQSLLIGSSLLLKEQIRQRYINNIKHFFSDATYEHKRLYSFLSSWGPLPLLHEEFRWLNTPLSRIIFHSKEQPILIDKESEQRFEIVNAEALCGKKKVQLTDHVNLFILVKFNHLISHSKQLTFQQFNKLMKEFSLDYRDIKNSSLSLTVKMADKLIPYVWPDNDASAICEFVEQKVEFYLPRGIDKFLNELNLFFSSYESMNKTKQTFDALGVQWRYLCKHVVRDNNIHEMCDLIFSTPLPMYDNDPKQLVIPSKQPGRYIDITNAFIVYQAILYYGKTNPDIQAYFNFLSYIKVPLLDINSVEDSAEWANTFAEVLRIKHPINLTSSLFQFFTCEGQFKPKFLSIKANRSHLNDPNLIKIFSLTTTHMPAAISSICSLLPKGHHLSYGFYNLLHVIYLYKFIRLNRSNNENFISLETFLSAIGSFSSLSEHTIVTCNLPWVSGKKSTLGQVIRLMEEFLTAQETQTEYTPPTLLEGQNALVDFLTKPTSLQAKSKANNIATTLMALKSSPSVNQEWLSQQATTTVIQGLSQFNPTTAVRSIRSTSNAGADFAPILHLYSSIPHSLKSKDCADKLIHFLQHKLQIPLEGDFIVTNRGSIGTFTFSEILARFGDPMQVETRQEKAAAIISPVPSAPGRKVQGKKEYTNLLKQVLVSLFNDRECCQEILEGISAASGKFSIDLAHMSESSRAKILKPIIWLTQKNTASTRAIKEHLIDHFQIYDSSNTIPELIGCVVAPPFAVDKALPQQELQQLRQTLLWTKVEQLKVLVEHWPHVDGSSQQSRKSCLVISQDSDKVHAQVCVAVLNGSNLIGFQRDTDQAISSTLVSLGFKGPIGQNIIFTLEELVSIKDSVCRNPNHELIILPRIQLKGMSLEINDINDINDPSETSVRPVEMWKHERMPK